VNSTSVIDDRTKEIAAGIVNDVAANGEDAVRKYAARFGDIAALDAPLVLTKAELEAAFYRVPKEERELLQRTATRVAFFAEAQRDSLNRELSVKICAGGAAGHSVAAMKIAGCYAPGGRYPLPSSVIMGAVPARVAGCEYVIAASPHPSDVTLAAAFIAGVDSFLVVGGAQAIAAMAFGLSGAMRLPACDVVVGPGNRFVTAAKALVQSTGRVAIDMLAGPSEVLVIADATADAAVVAADLIAQSEHDVLATAILVTTDGAFAAQVETHLAAQLDALVEPNRGVALQVRRSFLLFASCSFVCSSLFFHLLVFSSSRHFFFFSSSPLLLFSSRLPVVVL
jgi:phosphoribosyl-ATP pyrophosphohydrolase/phosphoribosyl-AMP cyclohydrolase/histidinol dehydrogenase